MASVDTNPQHGAAPGRGPGELGALGYRPPLDGIRALAIVLVVAFHTDRGGRLPVLWGGFLGVDVFFVLSGFLITSLLIDEHRGAGRVRLGAFWGRRAARLFPLLWALLALFALAAAVGPIAGIAPPSTLGFAALLAYVGNWIPATGRPDLYQLQYLWSLSVEEQFYVVWPLAAVALLRARPRWALALGAGVAAALVMALRPTVFADTDFFFNTVLRCDGLLLGAALAGARAWWQPRLGRTLGTALVAVGAGAAAVAIAGAKVGDPQVATWRLPLLEVGVLAITAALVAHPLSAPARVLGTAPLVRLGRWSYALYLVHLPIFDLVEAHLGADRPRLRAAVEIPIALAVAAAVHVAFELPAQRRLRRLLRVEHRPRERAPVVPELDAAS